MFSSVLSAAICGIKAESIHVEADVSDGLPMFLMVGYLSSQVKEAQERVKTAMKNSGFILPPKKITVNLSPADLRKEGSGFDLPIAVAVLAAYGYVTEEAVKGVLFAGELSLNGKVCGIRGILPMVRQAAEKGIKLCIVPKANEKEGAVISRIPVIGVDNLKELVDYLNGLTNLDAGVSNIEEMQNKYQRSCREDFKNINGQAAVKRGAEVAVAGMHNLLLIGPPGSGKSLIAKCIPGILPGMTLEESLEISEIYSVAGMLKEDEPLVLNRPFRSPHHTISAQALAGGGRIPRPGEISLSHGGVLFLDEMPEFNSSVLEILRQPMEDHQVNISRISGTYIYPANAMVVAAMNPCKCGHYPDMNRCTCTESEIHHYLHKISQPLLDRIDISIEAPSLEYEQISTRQKNESSASIKERVAQAQQIQQARYAGTEYRFNRDLNVAGIHKFCPLGQAESRMLESVFHRFKLSARAYHRIIKVARTVADLAGSREISCNHIGEAVCYRAIEQKFWI